MTRVLLLDASFAARPIHDWLVQAGFDVWTIGARAGDPLARRNPDRHIACDYSDVAAVQAHVDRLQIVQVVPGCTDVSMDTAIQLRAPSARLDGPEAHRQLTDKAAFRALCARLDLPAPRLVEPDALPATGRLIAKPVDSFSGRGITVFEAGEAGEAGAAERALAFARSESRSGRALLETFAEGDLHSYSAFLEAGRVAEAVVVFEYGSVSPFSVDTSFVRRDFPPEGEAALRDAIERIAAALALIDGLVHAQFLWDGARASLVEVTRRCPGDLYSSLIELSTGSPYAGRYAAAFVGQAGPARIGGAARRILRHTISAGHAPYEGFWPVAPLRVVEFHPLAPVGREAPAPSRIDRVGLLFVEAETETDLAQTFERFASRSAYRTRQV